MSDIDAVSQSQLLLAQGFDTLVDTLNNAPTMQVSTSSVISSLEVPTAVDGIQVMGASSTSDGQSGIYTRVTASGALTITSADGSFWDPVTPSPTDISATGTITCAVLSASGAVAGALLVSGSTRIMFSTVSLASSSGAAVATLLNSPVAGPPTKWVSLSDNGTVRWIPTWS